MTYREVRFKRTESSLDSVYGPSFEGPVYLPEGKSGEEILKQARQTEAERAECKKRGAE